jgi:hypothetical protein
MVSYTTNYNTNVGFLPEYLNTFLPDALRYHRAGLVVIPAYKTDTEKVTFPKGWNDYSNGKKQTEEEVRKLFSRQSWGLAIVCTDGMEVIDVDEKHDPKKEACKDFLRQVLKSNSEELITRCVHVHTKSDGHHFIYRAPSPGSNTKLSFRTGSDKAIIETRGKGGLIFATPTPGYEVSNGSYLNIPTITQAERDLLINAATDAGDKVEPVRAPTPRKETTTTAGNYPYTFTDDDKVKYL